MQLYPLLFEPIYKKRVWGGRGLERLGRVLPEGRYGESWEVADLPPEELAEDGHGATRSVVQNGGLAGTTLSELVRARAHEVLGAARPSQDGGFPLLVKYLQAERSLSVQVHPSTAYALEHPGVRPKWEAWYVVEAEPDALLYTGFHPGTTRAQVERAIREDAIAGLMVATPARVGDCHFLPSGTCHALGAGTLVAEIQTPSDTTFRLFDWGREGRTLHIDAALASIELGPAPRPVLGPGEPPAPGGLAVRPLVDCAHFSVEEWRAAPGSERVVRAAGPEVWMVIDGSIELRSGDDRYDPVRVPPGRTVVLPASLGGTACGAPDGALILRATVPLDGA